jgi:hypothetical protein
MATPHGSKKAFTAEGAEDAEKNRNGEGRNGETERVTLSSFLCFPVRFLSALSAIFAVKRVSSND